MIFSFVALLFFAIVVDQLDGTLGEAFDGAGVILDVVEDGGEMIAITTACALVLGAEHERRAR